MTDVITVVDATLATEAQTQQVVQVGYIAQTVQEGGGTPASTVTSETTYGIAPVVGVATAYARQDHTHGTPGLGSTASTAAAGNHAHARTVVITDSGFVESGNVTATTEFTQLGPDLAIAAAVGDVLEIGTDIMCGNTGSDVQFEAATRTAGADGRYWSSGTAVSRWPGGLGNWYVPSGAFSGPRGTPRYTVQAADVTAGQVTVRLYARVAAGNRAVFATATYPLRWSVTNLGALA